MERFKKILKWTAMTIAVIGIFTGSIFLIVGFLTKDAVEVANQELEVLRAGNIDSAYNTYTSQVLRDATPFETFKSVIEKYPILQTNTRVRYTYKSISASEGVNLSGILSGPNNSQAFIEIQLNKEGQSWKIIYLNVKPISN